MTRTEYLDGLTEAHRANIAAGRRRAVAYGLPVRIVSVSRSGMRIKFADGHIERAHPEDVTAA